MNDPFERLRAIPKGTKQERQLESSVKEGVLALLRSRWPRGLWFKVHQGGLTHSGGADVQGCLPVGRRGIFVAVELKAPKEFRKPDHHVTEVQAEFGRRVLLAGGIWGVAASAEGAARIIERGLSHEGRREMHAQLARIRAVHQLRRSIAAKRMRVTPLSKRWKRRFTLLRQRKYKMPVDKWGMLAWEILREG